MCWRAVKQKSNQTICKTLLLSGLLSRLSPTLYILCLLEPHHENACLCHMQTQRCRSACTFVVCCQDNMGRVKRIWYLSPMRAAKVQASLRIRAVSPEPPLLAHTSSESRGTFRQKARSLAPLNDWACAVKICHDGMLEDTNSFDMAHIIPILSRSKISSLVICLCNWAGWFESYLVAIPWSQVFCWHCSLEPPHDKTNKTACAPSKDSDQPGHLPSLIIIFAHMKKAWVLSYPLSAQWRLWSDWVNAQADLSLRWVHRSVCCWFCHEAAHLISFSLLIVTTPIYNSFTFSLLTNQNLPRYQSSQNTRGQSWINGTCFSTQTLTGCFMYIKTHKNATGNHPGTKICREHSIMKCINR